MNIPINKIQLNPGSLITLNNLTWEQFEAFLEEKEANGIKTRIAYIQGILTIISPLPAHERPHRIISDIVKILLDSQERDWEEFSSITFRKKTKQVALEADTCFYIQNAQKMRPRMRIDLTVDPPPDLAIEVDLTSKTTLDAYEALEVPELWIYTEEKFTIKVFTNGLYLESSISPNFPDLPILELIPSLINQPFTIGSSKMLRELRKKIS